MKYLLNILRKYKLNIQLIISLFEPSSLGKKIYFGVTVCAFVAIFLTYIIPRWICFLLFLVFAYFLFRSLFVVPLNKIIQLTKDFSLNEKIVYHYSGRDELSRMVRAVVSMSNRLQKSIATARTESAKLDEIFNVIGDGVILVDANLQIIKMNNIVRRWVGIYEDVKGKYLVDVLKNVELHEHLKVFSQRHVEISPESKMVPLIIESLTLEGVEQKVVHVKIISLNEDKGISFMIFLFDLTNFYLLQDSRREFFANVSHELKTPIAAIRGYAESISDMAEVKSHKLLQGFNAVILRNSKQLAKLIDEMLFLASLESRSLPLNIKPYDIQAALEKVVETLTPKAQSANVTLFVDVPKDLDVFMVDAQQFDSVLLNLMDNGVKYNKNGGFVKVSVRHNITENMFYFYVEDNGIGFDYFAQLRAFERFFRVDKSHSRLGGGTGLGLAIVKHIVQAHGGTITLRSEIGVGTVFTLAIPQKAFFKLPGN